MNQIISQEKNGNSSISMKDLLGEFELTRNLCQQLMKTSHYQKIGEPGIFAILHKALVLGIAPFDALNGGLYYTNGKVEMSSALMARLIRQKGHSITMQKDSGSQFCTIHGKRADNGDTMSATFTIEEARKAGLLNRKNKYGQSVDTPWNLYPQDMCYSRALSRLARRLFPDVIAGCYVEGEIPNNGEDKNKIDFDKNKESLLQEEREITINKSSQDLIEIEEEKSSSELLMPYVNEIEELLEEQPERRANLMNCIRVKWNVCDFTDLTIEAAKWIISRLKLPSGSNEKEEVK